MRGRAVRGMRRGRGGGEEEVCSVRRCGVVEVRTALRGEAEVSMERKVEVRQR
jgi:hypothetical protein